MIGILIEGSAFIYSNNQSVLANTSISKSVLKKKSYSLAYHLVHEEVVCDEW